LSLSFFCGRIGLVFARGGAIPKNIFLVTLGTITNFAWLPSLVWFFKEGYWFVGLISILVSLFGFNLLVTIQRPYLFTLRKYFDVVVIICLLLIWVKFY
jgi:hypothetical protein